MPYGKSKRRKTVRKAGRRRNKKRVGRTLARPGKALPFAAPKSMLVKMRYSDTITVNPPVGATANYFFRANDVWDPDYTGVGHSANSLDQWSNFYDHFTVIGSKITAKFIANSATSGDTCLVGIYVDDDVATVTDPHQLVENGGKYGIMANKDGGNNVKTVRAGFSGRKFFGVSDIVGDSLYRQTNGTSPTEQAYFHIWAAASNFGDPAAFNVLVTVDYLVVCTERRTLGKS